MKTEYSIYITETNISGSSKAKDAVGQVLFCSFNTKGKACLALVLRCFISSVVIMTFTL
jgi:hypothetical protein